MTIAPTATASAAGSALPCPPGCCWEATVLCFGRDTHGDWIDRRCAPSAVALLPHVPVGFFIDAGRLTHRPGGLIQAVDGVRDDGAHVVGIIDEAWVTPDGDGVNATIHLASEAERVRRALLRMERDHRLLLAGLSIVAEADDWAWLDPVPGRRRFLSLRTVYSVDVVTYPAGSQCCVRRRRPCPHRPAPRVVGATHTEEITPMNVTILGLRTTPTPGPVATPAEVLAGVEARRDTFAARLEVARTELAELRGAIAKSHEAYRTALTQAELAGESLPSREALNALRAREPEAADRVEALEGALAEVEGEWRRAKADVLDEQARALEGEAAERETLIRALREQIDALQRQIDEHAGFIRNNAGVRPIQLQAEARRLRSTP
jgi:hypothetical protein